MLGTPPAFILSQDQTLDKWYLNLRRELKSIDRVLLSSLLFLLIKRNCTRSFFTLSSSISLDFLCFVLSHMLFNFQGPLPLVFVRIASTPNSRRNYILPQLSGFVNTFSKLFSNFLKVFSSSLLHFCSFRHFRKALDYYSRWKTVCQHFFQDFFQFVTRVSKWRIFCLIIVHIAQCIFLLYKFDLCVIISYTLNWRGERFGAKRKADLRSYYSS